MNDLKNAKFSSIFSIDDLIRKAARIAVKEVLAVRKNEKVLIVTNPIEDMLQISTALYDAVIEAQGFPSLIFQPVKTQIDFAEETVIRAMQSNPDIIISISRKKMGKDKFGMKEQYQGKNKAYDHIFDYLYNEAKIRTFWSPSITKEMFAITVPIDYAELRKDCKKLVAQLRGADSVRITSSKGTDITIGLRGRKPKPDDGDFRKLGKGGNLPAGEVYVSPELGVSNGTIVYDGCISLLEGEIIIKEPIKVKVIDGFVRDISGAKEATLLKDTIKKAEELPFKLYSEDKITLSKAETYSKNARNLGELGIGLNKKARIVGNMLEDEKVYGTCHIALGSNYDEDAKALNHLDGLIKNPTIDVIYGIKTRRIMGKGKLTS